MLYRTDSNHRLRSVHVYRYMFLREEAKYTNLRTIKQIGERILTEDSFDDSVPRVGSGSPVNITFPQNLTSRLNVRQSTERGDMTHDIDTTQTSNDEVFSFMWFPSQSDIDHTFNATVEFNMFHLHGCGFEHPKCIRLPRFSDPPLSLQPKIITACTLRQFPP